MNNITTINKEYSLYIESFILGPDFEKEMKKKILKFKNRADLLYFILDINIPDNIQYPLLNLTTKFVNIVLETKIIQFNIDEIIEVVLYFIKKTDELIGDNSYVTAKIINSNLNESSSNNSFSYKDKIYDLDNQTKLFKLKIKKILNSTNQDKINVEGELLLDD